MTHTTPPAGTLDIVIFGGAGDLSFRKLLPALYMAHLHDKLDVSARIVAVGRQDWTRQEYLDFIDKNSPAFIEKEAFTKEDWQSFLNRLAYVSMDVTNASDFAKLKDMCNAPALRVYYLATAPSLFTQICANLSGAGLVDAQSRVVLEKPLGTDLASAREINTNVARYFDEQQIYRIDHYLGKETVQNLMVLRFGNAIFEPLWRAPYIKSVQITVAESVGVGSRAGFYDGAGAMRDMIQNHLLQLLCIVAMEPPISLGADDVRDEKLKVLRSLRKMDLADIKRDTVRGQYTAGASEGAAVKGYLEEDNVPANSRTETFVALRAQINNARWANVPFFLRTGKRMQRRESQIIIEFADQPFSIFGTSAQHEPNRLIITLQPEESIQLEMMVKEPGSGMSLHPVKLGLDLQQSSDKRRAEAYERLLMDVIKGRLTHFMRRDELEAAWMWVEPIINGWAELDDKPRAYSAGSWGPAASSALMAREELSWFEEA
ncbi:glucose-6-phosphate 1-dehydrogenase [Limnohabitans sp. MORI2]|uniref:glucose-6-phosphate dehydrogenase n=1 Tax=Limnohabitans sp. MORI2 TaxID=1751150 RepID=UPI002377B50A|nr:glucose-6-phosphate dehydrogenase [Limnohabitans sp. MORI2]BDU58342.1 glucose-6-phosphate 1-dehydrogenase [Limnohabitans sp. MORI2]